MSSTKINVGAVIDATSQISSAKSSVSSAKSAFNQTKNSIDGKIKNRYNINSRLSTVSNQLSGLDTQIGKIRSMVQSGANLYKTTDNTVESWAENVKNSVGVKSTSLDSSSWASYFNTQDKSSEISEKQVTASSEAQSGLEAFLSKSKPYAIASLLSTVSPVAGLLYVTSGLYHGDKLSITDPSRVKSSTAYGDWLGYETDEDHPCITAWLGKATAQAQNEWGYAGVNAYLGKAKAEADAGFAFMETTKKKEKVDGEWVEKTVTEFIKAEASAGASVSVLAADAEAGVGNDMLGIGVEGKGAVGTAKAEAKGKFSVTEDGVNANLSGEAMLAAAEGEAKGTINILGIEITGKVGGYAGAVGVEGKVGIEDNKFVMEGGVAALFGVSGGVEIGFNDEGWDNFVDFVTFWD